MPSTNPATAARLATASNLVDIIEASKTHDFVVTYAGRKVADLEFQPLVIKVLRLGQMGGKGKAFEIGSVVVTGEGNVEVRAAAQYVAEITALIN